MKPRIDISAQNNLTIWESGSWNLTQRLGRATVISGPEGEKLNVVFDVSPQNSNFHYLFFANAGQIVANAFVRQLASGNVKFDLELNRITSLTIEPVQGEPRGKANMEVLWTLKQHGAPEDYERLVDDSYRPDRVGYKKEYRDLVIEACKKAMTEASEQHLFWGVPRNSERTA